MATKVQIVRDAAGPEWVGRFWATTLGYIAEPPPEGYDSWDAALEALGVPESERDCAFTVDAAGAGPRIHVQRVPEAKTVKNRQDLDLNPARSEGSEYYVTTHHPMTLACVAATPTVASSDRCH